MPGTIARGSTGKAVPQVTRFRECSNLTTTWVDIDIVTASGVQDWCFGGTSNGSPWRFGSDWKALSPVGPGVYEIRVHTGVEHRVFYVARFSEAIYVLHAFEKKTRQTRSEDIDVARRRYARLEARRRGT